MSTLLFDIGGTNMRMAIGTGARVEHVQKIVTPERPHQAVAALVAYARVIPNLTGVSGGVAAVIEEGMIRISTHLPLWNEFDLANALEEDLHVPVHVGNDSEMAALGEAVYGAGKDHTLVGYIGVGTGVGGAYVANGEVVPHAEGFEPGHQVLDIATGKTFEDLVSGHALMERYGKPAKEIPRDIYKEQTPALAAGVYNAILDWSPEVLVLGGSLMNEENGYRIQEVEEALAAIPSVLPSLPLIRHAALGDENGLYGALAFGRP